MQNGLISDTVCDTICDTMRRKESRNALLLFSSYRTEMSKLQKNMTQLKNRRKGAERVYIPPYPR